MIIVEGPDNSGKSTLIEEIKREFPQVKQVSSGRHGPPKNATDIKERTEIILKEAIRSSSKRSIIVDRFPLIGESIYGPILRGKDLWIEIPQEKIRLDKVLNILNPFIIYCRPDKDVILDMSHHRIKDYDTKEHILNINKNQELIIKAYDNYFYRYNPFNFYRYDYKKEDSFKQLKEILGEYLKW